jgi:hypothetical protein
MSYDGSRAFDGEYDPNLFWATGYSVPPAGGHWVAYDFGSSGLNVVLQEIAWHVGNDTGYPTSIAVDWSDDNVTWTEQWTGAVDPPIAGQPYISTDPSPEEEMVVGPVRVTGMSVELALPATDPEAARSSFATNEVAYSVRARARHSLAWIEVVKSLRDTAPIYTHPRRRKMQLGISKVPALVPWPEPPVILGVPVITGSPTSSTITLSFVPVPFADSYEYRLDSGAPLTLPEDKILLGLAASTDYLVELRAVNENGPGAWSLAIVVRTLAITVVVPPPPDPTPAVPLNAVLQGGIEFYGHTGSRVATQRVVVTNNGLTYYGSGGVAPYTYEWSLVGDIILESVTAGDLVSTGGEYAHPQNPNGGFTKFEAQVPWGYMMHNYLKCTVTDYLGAQTSFEVYVTLDHEDTSQSPVATQ